MRSLAIALAIGCTSGAHGPDAGADLARPACPAMLAPTHLYESYCAGGAGFCFVDHEVPF